MTAMWERVRREMEQKGTHGHGQEWGDYGGEGDIRGISGNGKNTFKRMNIIKKET